MPALTTPLIGRSKTPSQSSTRTSATTSGKTRAKSNGSILNFFKKATPPSTIEDCSHDLEGGLFLEDEVSAVQVDEPIQTPTPPRDYFSAENSPHHNSEQAMDMISSRYNEDNGPSKRRRVNWVLEASPLDIGNAAEHAPRNGPFIEESDDDNEMAHMLPSGVTIDAARRQGGLGVVSSSDVVVEGRRANKDTENPIAVSFLKQESTSINEGRIEDFLDDEFPEEGEEYLERRWMEEQRQFEEDFDPDGESESLSELSRSDDPIRDDETAGTCPICSDRFVGFTEQQASVHVNNCLDGKAESPSPSKTPSKTDLAQPSVSNSSMIPHHKRFQRAAIARPGQENPFRLASNNMLGSSAFSQLMSSHAEDTAWATAAASETASRGKPAYQRTCPFYKILPGFSICVDAFRYGAVENCKAYFLSHFHSDHYIGLTSSWCHGPIYCSHVTANLVRRQLRVDPKWVFDLDFDKKVEVPETGGVEVTMIPANHCPGSSLYLFEKVVGKGKTPKVQRILHCGDFRACPAHVQHPQLRPDIVDTITGKSIAQQRLDVCYLDTTYLTPKYAFPSQEEVIGACADMCVSLSKDFIDENDSWEKTKKERAGTGMVQFVQKDSRPEIELLAVNELLVVNEFKTVIDNPQPPTNPTEKPRGRLLVIVGTYSIGKERICLGVARALNSKIYATPAKQKICAALEDPELNARLTSNPLEAQVHMQMLMEMRADTLADYLTTYKPHFSRVVGFRPSGWNYRPPSSRLTDNPAVHTVLHSPSWRSRYTMRDLMPQRGSTREAQCFGVPYSEHSSFRELTLFVCALRIDRIVPTVNVGSAKSREKMRTWCERWAVEKKKNGLYRVEEGAEVW